MIWRYVPFGNSQCCALRDKTRWKNIETCTTSRVLVAYLTQVFPIVNIEREEAHPWTVVIRLIPNTFIGKITFVTLDFIEIVFRAIVFYSLNECSVLRKDRIDNRLTMYHAPARKWGYECTVISYIEHRFFV